MGINETWRSEMQMLTPRLLFVIWFIKTLRYTNRSNTEQHTMY